MYDNELACGVLTYNNDVAVDYTFDKLYIIVSINQ